MFRKVIDDDTKQIKEILMTSFDMNDVECNKMLNMIQPLENTFLIEINNEVVSVASAIPFVVGDKKGRYIYAVATKLTQRKKGYADQLLKNIIKLYKDIDVLLLKPAYKSLFDYYRKVGFNKTIKAKVTEYNYNNELSEVEMCDIEDYFALRTKYNAFVFPENVIKYYVKEYGYKTVKNSSAIAMYRKQDNVCIDEIYGDETDKIINAIIYKENVKNATVVQKGNEDFALAYFYNEPFEIDFRIPME